MSSLKEGDWISLDGTSGEVFVGKIELTNPNFEEQTDLLTFLDWADEICATKVFAKLLKVGRQLVCRFGRMLIIQRMHNVPVHMAQKVLVFAVPSTCSLNRPVCQLFSA